MRISDWSADVCSADRSDEEISSPGSAPLIAEAAQGKHAALTYEPAMPDGMLAGARPGSGNFSIALTGKAAHAGRHPEEGRHGVGTRQIGGEGEVVAGRGDVRGGPVIQTKKQPK